MRTRRSVTGRIAAAALGALSVLHLAWARGASWPCTDRTRLADSVAGSSRMPSRRACYAVAAVLATAACVVRKPPGTKRRRVSASIVASVLAGRGLVGVTGRTNRLLQSALSDRFRRLDRCVYAPLCLALAGLIVASQRRPKRPSPGRSADPLPAETRAILNGARRFVVIASASANGKTTLARQLAARFDLPFVEMDALVHGPGWVETTNRELRRLIEPTLGLGGWVIDGDYHRKIGPLVLDAADAIIWLDLPLRIWLPRLLRRSVRRLLRRQVLWNGNRETLGGVVWGRDSLVGYGLRTHFQRRRSWPRELAAYSVIRLRSPAEIDAFAASVIDACVSAG